jgi:hypothetical protein
MKKLLDNEAVLFGLERTSYQVSAKLAEKSTGYLSVQVGESQTPYSKNVTEPHMTSTVIIASCRRRCSSGSSDPDLILDPDPALVIYRYPLLVLKRL